MNTATFTKDLAQKTITVTRTFNANRSKVWHAFTDREMLEKWWAPKPWKTVVKAFDFKEGGVYHYCMQGPDGTQSWGLTSYETIDPENSYTAEDFFCDEQGIRNTELPTLHWKNEFIDNGETTDLVVTISFESESDMQKVIEMGFEEGFTMGLDQLDTLLQP